MCAIVTRCTYVYTPKQLGSKFNSPENWQSCSNYSRKNYKLPLLAKCLMLSGVTAYNICESPPKRPHSDSPRQKSLYFHLHIYIYISYESVC